MYIYIYISFKIPVQIHMHIHVCKQFFTRSFVRSFGRSVKSESITDPLRFVQSALHGLQRCLEPQHLETGLVEFRKQLMRLPVKIVKWGSTIISSFLILPELLTFDKVHNPLRLPRKGTSEPPKVVRTPGVLTFWLRNMLRATTACIFSTSELPKVVRQWCF